MIYNAKYPPNICMFNGFFIYRGIENVIFRVVSFSPALSSIISVVFSPISLAVFAELVLPVVFLVLSPVFSRY